MTDRSGPATAPRRGKDRGIEALRGIAVVLMVAGHVIGEHSNEGLNVADDSAWRFFYAALEDLRMPLFATLSGFVYAYRPVQPSDGLKRLVTGKTRRLLIPFVVVCTVFFFVQLATPGTNTRPRVGELWRAYVYGYQHLWFLQAIFLIFMVVGALDAFDVMRSFRRWAAVTAAACALFVVVHLPNVADVFSVNGAIRLLPFFLLGYGAHRFAESLMRPGLLLAATAAFLPVYGLRLWTIATDVTWDPMPTRLLSLTVAVLVVVTLLAVRTHLQSRALVWMGGFSFGIYLLHVFGTAGARIVAIRLGVSDTAVLFVLCMIVGIALPIVFELLLGRFKVVSWGVLGQRPRRARPAAAPEVGRVFS